MKSLATNHNFGLAVYLKPKLCSATWCGHDHGFTAEGYLAYITECPDWTQVVIIVQVGIDIE
jgi:hypothetical protein